jgi:hypothetical protein
MHARQMRERAFTARVVLLRGETFLVLVVVSISQVAYSLLSIPL